MKKGFYTALVACVLASSMLFSSCVGSFALSGKVLSWNRSVGGKFVNELVFLACCIVPVYEITILADGLILNTIEFWSGNNPAHAYNTTIDTEQGKVLIACDGKGYDITNEATGESVRFDYDEMEQTWSVQSGDESYAFMQFVDDSHVKMLMADGTFTEVELSQEGVYAYTELTKNAVNYALNR
jgi:hypothetical protein